ncbi:MAG: 1-deoxy-D-xylulose-5-phosphate synthase [Actinomycetaceae bacterium]|nr:1-deoxy-D-xylulose-5-phosphate synthase [Actinomycetaceae bacterium]
MLDRLRLWEFVSKGLKVARWLEQINSPRDLRHLTSDQLNELSQEIRDFLVTSVSTTGGHLGPNLGVVELTIALHRVFDCPKDTLIFDTGHQSYVHKLLTGRKDFSMLRQEGGLSGYPSRAESRYDVLENSHASTSLAWMDGIARARALLGDPGRVITVIGDGALTGGMAWEALNNIASGDRGPMVIVVNDNGRSYAPTIGGLAHHLDALRVNPGYEKVLEWGKTTLQGKGRPGQLAYEALHGLKKGVKDVLAPQQGMFEDLGLKYIGPVDGHDITALEFAFTRVKDYNEPVLVHVITQKGSGYSPALENDEDRFHAVGKIHPETGLPVDKQRFQWTAVFADEILHLAQDDPRIVGITAAMLRPVGLGPFKDAYPNRVFDVGIAEQEAIANAAGMAYGGLHPVVALYATFMNRAYDQVLMDAALHRAGITIVLDRAGITGEDGASHNGVWDIALLSTVPGLRIAAPRDEVTLREELDEAVKIAHAPTVLRYPKGALPAPSPAIRRVGSVDILADCPADGAKQGSVLLLGIGPFVATAKEIAQSLSEHGWDATVADPRWIIPIGRDLVNFAKSFDTVVTIEDGIVTGGFGSQLRDSLCEGDCAATVYTFGVPKEFLEHASRGSILEGLGLSAQKITKKILAKSRSLRTQ